MPFRLGLTSIEIQSALTNQGYTTARAAKLDKLNTSVGTRATSGLVAFTSANARMVWNVKLVSANVAGSFGNLDQSKLNTTVGSRFGGASGISHVQTAMTNQGYTAAKAAFLNTTIGSRMIQTSLIGLTPAGARAVWQVLAASAGTAATSFGYKVKNFLNTAVSTRAKSGLSVTVGTLSTAAARTVWNVTVASATVGGTFGKVDGTSVQSGLTKQGLTTAVTGKINTSISSRFGGASGISHVQTAMTNQGYTAARALFINTAISTRAKSGLSVSLSTAGARVVWSVTVASANVAGTFGRTNQKSTQTGLTLQGLTTAVTGKINTSISSRFGGASGISHVQTAMTNQNYTSTRGGYLDLLNTKLNTTISSRFGGASGISHVQTAMTNQGYTTTRAAFLNTAIGSRAKSGLSVSISTAAARLVWRITTASASTAGTFGVLVKTDLNTTMSSRAIEAQVFSHVTSALNANGYTAARGVKLDFLNTSISSRAKTGDAMSLSASGMTHVQTAMTNQGYTVARAAFLNTAIGSRAKSGLSVTVGTLATAAARTVWKVTLASAAAAGTFGFTNQKSVQTGLTIQGLTTALSAQLTKVANPTSNTKTVTAASNTTGVALNLDAGYRSVLELRYTLTVSALASVMFVEGSDTATGGTWYVGDTWTEPSAATSKVVGYMTCRRYNRVRTTKTGVGVTFEMLSLL